MNETIKIAIQGQAGAFHEIAARLYHQGRRIAIVPCDTFAELAEAIVVGHAECGMMAIENSIAGSLLNNYQLIHQTPLLICGEIYLRIRQNLLALPGTSMDNLTEVHSHYMAIAQSKVFFEDYPHIKLVESNDTAESAKNIEMQKLTGIGAIASSLAADIYNLKILHEGIETNKLNYTRFFVVKKEATEKSSIEFDKVSVSFTLSHRAGSLFSALSVLNDYNVNLTKIQSLPIPDKPWEYMFFIDFMIQDSSQMDVLFGKLSHAVHDLKVLGKYKSGIKYEN